VRFFPDLYGSVALPDDILVRRTEELDVHRVCDGLENSAQIGAPTRGFDAVQPNDRCREMHECQVEKRDQVAPDRAVLVRVKLPYQFAQRVGSHVAIAVERLRTHEGIHPPRSKQVISAIELI
jgi:hypothetical protein